ncbi:hypothetical protein [Achromobacter dolens]|uniref:hypothetical protein n=1 Tax=Achromobacter dolens TaxID=1287738 RepID=UPI0031E3E388
MTTTIPAGWKLVPIEPTNAMVVEGVNAGIKHKDEPYFIYAAMLAAAPAAPGVSTVEDARAEQVTAILWAIMHEAQAAKEPCGDDPESAAAIRNGKLATIAGAAAQALGLVRGPDYPAPAAGDAQVLAALRQAHMALIGFMPQHRNSVIVSAIVAAREAIDAAEEAQRKGDA